MRERVGLGGPGGSGAGATKRGESYGIRMEFLWKSYGIPLEHYRSNTVIPSADDNRWMGWQPPLCIAWGEGHVEYSTIGL